MPEVPVPAAQAEVDALLRRLSGGDPVETHISAVYVGADTVWKLRRAVRLDFLDFSELGERRRAALRELELNQPGAPGLYRDVVPVTREAGGLALDGPGEAVDWVVRMARVPAADFLEAVIARGGLSPDLLDGLGDAVAASHAAAPAMHQDPAAGMRDAALGNARAALAAGLEPPVVRQWLETALGDLQLHASLLRQRGAAGHVRRAHGDLHLGNLCLWRGRPTLFDALEFDEALATVDTGYDLAFLLMDLDIRAGRAAANRVLNRVVARTGDAGFLVLLPMFLRLRAMVRAHVEASRLNPAASLRYLAAATPPWPPQAPVLVAIGGLPGSGKSTLARALAPTLGAAPGALVLRSDEIRKRQHGVAPDQRLPQSAYGPAANAATFAAIVDQAAAALAAGHSVIADAMFIDAGHRRAIRAAAGDAAFLGVWLHAPLQALEARVADRTGDASDADLAVLRRVAVIDPGPGDWLAVEATDRAVALARVNALL